MMCGSKYTSKDSPHPRSSVPALGGGGRPSLRSAVGRVMEALRLTPRSLQIVKRAVGGKSTPLQLAIARRRSQETVFEVLSRDVQGAVITDKRTPPAIFTIAQVLLHSDAQRMMESPAYNDMENEVLWEAWNEILETLKYRYPGAYDIERDTFIGLTLRDYLQVLSNETGIAINVLESLDEYERKPRNINGA